MAALRPMLALNGIWVSEWVSQSVSQSVCQYVSQSVSQSVSEQRRCHLKQTEDEIIRLKFFMCEWNILLNTPKYRDSTPQPGGPLHCSALPAVPRKHSTYSNTGLLVISCDWSAWWDWPNVYCSSWSTHKQFLRTRRKRYVDLQDRL